MISEGRARGGVPRRALAVALALAACSPARQGPPSGIASDPVAHARWVAERAAAAEVIYLGELHDNPEHHAHQHRVLEAMVGAGGRPAVGFEMLAAERQAQVERAVADAADATALDAALGWTARGWPALMMYWPLFALARERGLPVLALDLDPALARRVGREGLAALGAAALPLRSVLPADPAREAAIADEIRRGHCGLLPESRLPAMVEAWHARNVVMARQIVLGLARAPQVVVVIGRGHQAPGGLPAQLAAIRPNTRQLALDMDEGAVAGAEASQAGSAAALARRDPPGLERVAWSAPAPRRAGGDPCAGLRRSGPAT
jgi:uncharacterized iron-regulated protein